MRRDGFIYFGRTDSLFYGALEDALVEVVAHGFSRFGIVGSLRRGKDILPRGFTVGVGVFAFEGIRKVYFAIAFFQVSLVNAFDVLNVFFEGRGNAFGKGNGTVAFAFAIADNNLAVGKVNIFDAEAEAFHEPETRTEEELSH